MPVYSYKALSETGRKLSGVIDADSLAIAKEKLKARGVFVTGISSQKASFAQSSVSQEALMNFTREMFQLQRAGLPLYESLLTMEEKYRKHKMHPLFISLCDQIKSGRSLSFALSQHPKVFDSIYLALIRAAEQSGKLSDAFSSLYDLLGKQQKLKKQLKTSLAYPGFLALFCLVIVFFLLFYIIPSMQELFEGRALHPMTSFVLGVSRFMTEHISLVAVAALLPALAAFVAAKNKKAKEALFSLLCRLPLISRVLTLSSLVRFFRSIHLLLKGGVPLTDALRFSKKTMRHVFLEEVIENAEKELVQGKRLSMLLTTPLMPPLVPRMMAIAEQTGSLSITVESLSVIFEEDLDKDLLQLTTFLQPAILMLLGIVIGVVVLSILLPLTDVSSFLTS